MTMYQSHFGLGEAPFSIAPSPRYLYMSQRHQEALAHLLYGIQGEGGFVLLTGEVGTGKTTICRCLLEQIPEICDVAYIFNPKLTVEELLSTICAEFGIACPSGNTSIKVFVDGINEHLLNAHAKGRHAVLIIDEAQNLSADVLEQIRLLTNLETNERKLLQIILLGQPELREMLARPELRQLAQRIIASYHLEPLDRAEVAAYVGHRLAVAGNPRPLFTTSVLARLHRLSGGVPRVINVLCDRALLGAFVQGKDRVDRATLDRAAGEVLPRVPSKRRGLRAAFALGLSLLVGSVLAWVSAQSPLAPADAGSAMSGPSGEGHALASGRNGSAKADDFPWPGNISTADANTNVLAYRALLGGWGVTYQGGDLCREAEAAGLRCRSGRGGLDELRGLDLPAVLDLRDSRGRPFKATLVRLEPHGATLLVGGQTRTVALSGLATRWNGDYRLLWRGPPGVEGPIRAGARGAEVDWLRGKLAELEGMGATAIPGAVFDEALLAQVKRFQLAQGLVPDGSVGPETLIRLVRGLDPQVPSLSGPMQGR